MKLTSLTLVLAATAAAFTLGLSAENANAHVTFTDGSAADSRGMCHPATKGVTYRVDNLGNKPLFYRIIGLNLDDGSRTPDAWSRIDPRNSHANIIQFSTFLEPAHPYRFYIQYSRYIGRWQSRVEWVRGIGVCVL
jgi:hypothetical protein